MKRRQFLINSTLTALAVSTSGFICFDGKHYMGDCETTTDILGPFYRPNSPVRTNLLISGEKGTPITLSGIIRHQDCISPCHNAKVELWHCDSNGVYDNSSADFRYRATGFSDEKGFYSFNTILPVPYHVGSGIVRPAHFHLMITAQGYQPLVTQLYFTGDPNIMKDPSSASPAAKNRILKVQHVKDGSKKVVYDITMTASLALEAASVNKLAGTYTNIKDPNNKKELFQKGNKLWLQNEVFGELYEYVGNNKFEYPGMPKGSYASLQFDLMANGAVQFTLEAEYGSLKCPVLIYLKDKKG